MSGYNSNIYNGGAIPDQGANGLPLILADANLPTQLVSAQKMGNGTSLNYSPSAVESQFVTPSNAYPKPASAPVKAQKFTPTPQPQPPKLWRTVLQSVIAGGTKVGTTYAATGTYQGSSDAPGGVTPYSGGNGTAGIGTVSPGGAKTQ